MKQVYRNTNNYHSSNYNPNLRPQHNTTLPLQDQQKFTTDELISYITKNLTEINDINYVDLNKHSQAPLKINTQEVKIITYLPPKLNEIFKLENNRYLHAGANRIAKCNFTNISLFSSVMICLKQSFLSQNLTMQQAAIIQFTKCLEADVQKFNYARYNWSKTFISDCIKKGSIGKHIIKYVADYLCVNIFVLELESDRLVFCGGNEYIPYKKSIFLIKYRGEDFEPMYTEHGKFFAYDDPLMKFIRSNMNMISVYELCDAMIGAPFAEYVEPLESYSTISKNGGNSRTTFADKVILGKSANARAEKDVANEKLKNYVPPAPNANTAQVAKKAPDTDAESSTDTESSTNTDASSASPAKKPTYTAQTLKNSKLTDLQAIATTLRISHQINNKNKTKQQLQDEILARCA